MLKQKRIFRGISGDNRGLVCPFKGIVCAGGDCQRCQIYVDWQKLGELLVICAWCGKLKRRAPNSGQPIVSHGICLECQKEHFPKTRRRATQVCSLTKGRSVQEPLVTTRR